MKVIYSNLVNRMHSLMNGSFACCLFTGQCLRDQLLRTTVGRLIPLTAFYFLVKAS